MYKRGNRVVQIAGLAIWIYGYIGLIQTGIAMFEGADPLCLGWPLMEFASVLSGTSLIFFVFAGTVYGAARTWQAIGNHYTRLRQ